MAVTLQSLNLALDILLKTVLIAAFIYGVLILHNLDRTIRSVQRSAESIEEASKRLGRFFRIARYMPFVGPRRWWKRDD